MQNGLDKGMDLTEAEDIKKRLHRVVAKGSKELGGKINDHPISLS